MKKPLAERHEPHRRRAEPPLGEDTDPRGFPYLIRGLGGPMPCYVRPALKKE